MTRTDGSVYRERRCPAAGRRYTDPGASGTDVRLAHLEERLISAVDKFSDFVNQMISSQKENTEEHSAILNQLATYKSEFDQHTMEEKWWRRVVALVLIVIAGEPFLPILEHIIKALL